MTVSAVRSDALAALSADLGGGRRRLDLLAPEIHCAGCIGKIEGGLKAVNGVLRARVNLSTRRVLVEWDDRVVDVGSVVGRLEALGFAARPFDAGESGQSDDDRRGRELLRALAVAGFASANVMLLSVSVWSGAQDTTRELFHWFSALIALPALVYAARPFLRSAVSALRRGHFNMDVPISLALALAAGMSFHETLSGGAGVYFDAALMLCFFLLTGRYLDHMTRARARSAVTRLLSLSPAVARVIGPDGVGRHLPLAEIEPGMTVAVAPGERIPVDGRVIDGASDLDRSIVTGETVPEAAGPGSVVEAGTLNLTGSLRVEAGARGKDGFLSRVIRLMDAAEQSRSRHVRLADAAARIYAPVVHVAAAATFVGWVLWSGDWRLSLLTAISVLIITCPCALGLAVPAVQVVAGGRLFRHGVMVKDGDALERLSEVDTVVFDKTGTLTSGRPRLTTEPKLDRERLASILALAAESLHPLARALAERSAGAGEPPPALSDVKETPGSGLSANCGGRTLKLGSRLWCLGAAEPRGEGEGAESTLYASLDGEEIARFGFRDELRADAGTAVSRLKSLGLEVALLSGDREPAVAAAAERAGIEFWRAEASPAEKLRFISQLGRRNRRALMVGDGVNDAPALAAAHASMAPSNAADVGRTAAGLVFTGPNLGAVVHAVKVARLARRLTLQNFAMAALYNLIAVPVAVLGYAGPLVAALAMSSSSILVTANALRLRGSGPVDPEAAVRADRPTREGRLRGRAEGAA